MSCIQQDNENGKNVNKDAIEATGRYHLDGLKRKKTLAKVAFIRTRIGFWSSRRQIREALQQIDDAQVILEIIVKIADE